MKKIISIFLSAALLFCLTACNIQQSDPTPSPELTLERPAPVPTEPTPAESSAPADGGDASAADGKVLVVYYSATNRTEAVAQTIAETLEAELFEIVPAMPYTSDDLNYRDENSRVYKEHEDPALQEIELEKATPDNWEEYDTVFIGYPIWWGNASWVVTSFAAANDFTGKTVIPFCTSASSSLGQSDKNLAAAANGGDWQEGMRFSSSVNSETVTEWLSGLEL